MVSRPGAQISGQFHVRDDTQSMIELSRLFFLNNHNPVDSHRAAVIQEHLSD